MYETLGYLGLAMTWTAPLLFVMERGNLEEGDFLMWLYSRPLDRLMLIRANTLSGFLFMLVAATQKIWS